MTLHKKPRNSQGQFKMPAQEGHNKTHCIQTLGMRANVIFEFVDCYSVRWSVRACPHTAVETQIKVR